MNIKQAEKFLKGLAQSRHVTKNAKQRLFQSTPQKRRNHAKLRRTCQTFSHDKLRKARCLEFSIKNVNLAILLECKQEGHTRSRLYERTCSCTL